MYNNQNNIFNCVPPYPGSGDREYFDGKHGSIILRISNTSKQMYDDYLKILAESGFIYYAGNCIRDNYYATIVNQNILLQVYFTAHDKITRIIADRNTNLYKREIDVVYGAKNDTVLYQMELDYRNIDCGMCYITQCADGSFFIIDSAHMNSVKDHNRLYDFLRRLTPEGREIVISGWFFTHAHQDHIAMFMEFIKAGFKDCQIECLYYNFPSLSVLGSEKWKDTDKQTMKEFDGLIEKHKEIPCIKLHTGQSFFVRNLALEVLATHEDIYPGSLSCFNDSSTVLMMTVSGCKVLFLGDANVAECTILLSRYGSYLKSDIIQVSHHGFNSANVGIYLCAVAMVSLYPTRQSKFDENKFSESNKKVIELSKEIFIAGNGTAAFKLPYKLGTSILFPEEITDS